jgi:hypothetical protein
MMSSCDQISDLFSRYAQASVAPTTIATFSSSDIASCPTFPAELDTSALPLAQFAGIDQAAVGHSGQFEIGALGGGHKVDAMHTAIKFNFDDSGIPLEAFNETMVANLVFVYNLTARSERNSTCHLPISGADIATTAWDSSSDFYSPLPSRPFTTVGCDLISGSRTNGAYRCLVSEAIIDWARDAASNPNYGFVVHPRHRVFDSCVSNIGEPGNRVECVAELSSIGLNVEYVAP